MPTQSGYVTQRYVPACSRPPSCQRPPYRPSTPTEWICQPPSAFLDQQRRHEPRIYLFPVMLRRPAASSPRPILTKARKPVILQVSRLLCASGTVKKSLGMEGLIDKYCRNRKSSHHALPAASQKRKSSHYANLASPIIDLSSPPPGNQAGNLAEYLKDSIHGGHHDTVSAARSDGLGCEAK
ncbi:hypothetical protein K438DRAFT_1781074 [Mycena galopus ATCC 62051]|nr:hypothetical protein K438DRAFT_1781074 [Mycena galopus ATCC 62051]